MKIKITVTREVLEKTKMCGSVQATMQGESIVTHCAIAYAVRQLFPNAVVNYGRLYFDPSSRLNIDRMEQETYTFLPFAAQSFINLFDSMSHDPQERLLLPEFSFEIEVPAEVIDKIGIGECYKILSESKTLELVNP